MANEFLIRLFVHYPVLLFAITVHEYSHGKMAERFGDNTAKILGRLTLNPLAHIDLFGTVILPIFSMLSGVPLFGWAKPVPVNMALMTKKEIMFVGLSGPLANILLAGMFSLTFYLTKVLNLYFVGSETLFETAIVINVVLAVFNLTPIPPLDGSRVVTGLLPYRWGYYYNTIFERYGFFIIIFLLYTGILWKLLSPIVSFLTNLFLTSSVNII